MQLLRNIFLYEFLTGGGSWFVSSDPPSGSLLAEGKAMRDALAADIAAISSVDCVHLFHDIRLPPPQIPKQQLHLINDGAEKLNAFVRLACENLPAVLIAPEFDENLHTIAGLYQCFRGLLLSPEQHVIESCGDKQRSCDHLEAHGFCVPNGTSWLSEARPNELDASLLPAVLKPNDGCGSQGVQMIESLEELAAVDLSSATTWRLEKYHPGTHVSTSVLTGPLGVLPLQPCTQRLSDDGRFTYLGGATPIPEQLAERAKKLAQAAAETLLPCRGYLGIDMVLGSAEDGSQDVVIEINPRLTTSYLVLRQACEQNLAEAMLQWALGEPVTLTWRPQRFEYLVPST
ncbi:ATP-grasp domain-containing protein [Anatilimnocola floriformis]|uniref:ATP-grasp domain-containing protein n=1 Tax=Anatilimnocola floriformis TaxID=2948575 RepID=UPI0020C490C0|nr:ATP-grasp domain-containing protein [Anatilimnocola floriformis]